MAADWTRPDIHHHLDSIPLTARLWRDDRQISARKTSTRSYRLSSGHPCVRAFTSYHAGHTEPKGSALCSPSDHRPGDGHCNAGNYCRDRCHCCRCREDDPRAVKGTVIAPGWSLVNAAYAARCMIGPLFSGLIRNAAGWQTTAWCLGLLSGVTGVFLLLCLGGWIGKIRLKTFVARV